MSHQNPFYTLIAELSDIFGEWDDVMDTAYELEQFLTDGMSQLANFDYASIADDLQQGLSEIKEKLDDANLLDGLGDQIQEALKDLKDQVNIDLEAPFNVPDIGDLSNLKELIGKYLPDVPGVDFGPMTDAITKLMNLIDLPDINVALRKTSGGSYPEGIEAAAQSAMQAAIPPTTPSNINTAQTATNGTSNAATGTPPNNDWLQAMIPDWKTHEEAIEGLMTKLESAFDELAIMDQVQASMDKLMPQIEQLKTVADITPILTTLIKDVGSEVAPALKKVLDIFTEAFEDFKKLLISLKAAKLPKDLNANQWYQLLTFGGGKEPGLLTIPCLVLAPPLCFMSKALTGKRPELGGVFQGEGERDDLAIAVGAMEIIEGSFSLMRLQYTEYLQRQFKSTKKDSFNERKEWWQKNNYVNIFFDFIDWSIDLIKVLNDSLFAEEFPTGRKLALWMFESFLYVFTPPCEKLVRILDSKSNQWNDSLDYKEEKDFFILNSIVAKLFMSNFYMGDFFVDKPEDERKVARTWVLIIRLLNGFIIDYKGFMTETILTAEKPKLTLKQSVKVLTLNIYQNKETTDKFKFTWNSKDGNEWKNVNVNVNVNQNAIELTSNDPVQEYKVKFVGKLRSTQSVFTAYESVPFKILKLPSQPEKLTFIFSKNGSITHLSDIEGKFELNPPPTSPSVYIEFQKFIEQTGNWSLNEQKYELKPFSWKQEGNGQGDKRLSIQTSQIDTGYKVDIPSLDLSMSTNSGKDALLTADLKSPELQESNKSFKWYQGNTSIPLQNKKIEYEWKEKQDLIAEFRYKEIHIKLKVKGISIPELIAPESESESFRIIKHQNGQCFTWKINDKLNDQINKDSYQPSVAEFNEDSLKIEISFKDELGIQHILSWSRKPPMEA